MTTSPASPSPISAEEVKHLEMIQAIVTRLANGSFLIKGWTMTIAGVFFGLAASNLSWKLTVSGMIPLFGFWLLDGYYLRQERLFRKLYDDVREPAVTVESFSMNTASYYSNVPWWGVVRSHTLVNFYGVLLLVDLAFTAAAVFNLMK
ncbi:hypothetical protein [Streptomyces sp. NPDC058855]|uniref:hypothetical protein n=1 Tax=Streptomyces sp. NPDC058855 TaxID=3346651 RepID=UPI0036B74ED2